MFFLRGVQNRIRRPLMRQMTSSTSKECMVDISVDQEGIALITMNRKPVNSMNLEFLQQVSSAIDVAQKERCKGLIITSGARVFSAGLDLVELEKPDLNRLRTFWSKLQDIFLQLYGSGEITSTVAINGYTAAGGCVITTLCDYRVMVDETKARIGLNDTAVGIVPRPWLCEVMTQVMGQRQAEIALTASTMYTAQEALKVNLVDELAINKEDAIEKCKQFIRKYDNIPPKIKARTKRNIRENTIKLVEMNREEDTTLFTEGILDPFVQEQISKYVQQLKSKK